MLTIKNLVSARKPHWKLFFFLAGWVGERWEINIINTDSFYSILCFYTENFQIIINFSKFLIKLKTSVGFTVVKLEWYRDHHMAAPAALGGAWWPARPGAEGADHFHSFFTSSLSLLGLNRGICWPSLSSKKTSWRFHLRKTKSIVSHQQNTEAKDMV